MLPAERLPHGLRWKRCARRFAQSGGQEAAVVIADLARDQPIQKRILAQDEFAVGDGVYGEIDHLVRIVSTRSRSLRKFPRGSRSA